MPVKSVGFAIGNLRARENRMLKKSDMLRLAAASDTDELAAALSDCGIDKKDGAEIPEMLSAETEKLWKYLTDNAPDMSLFEPFIYENDFHNFKAVLKGTVRNRDYGRLLITPASVDVVLLERAVKEKGGTRVVLHAQVRAKEFYEKQGYQPYGEIGFEEGCPHIWMYKIPSEEKD